MNKGAFSPGDTWLVINSDTGIALESQPSEARARQAAGWVNEHEARCGRSTTYYCARVTAE
jgi:hypothetical protein